jgi:hypothetical protein
VAKQKAVINQKRSEMGDLPTAWGRQLGLVAGESSALGRVRVLFSLLVAILVSRERV